MGTGFLSKRLVSSARGAFAIAAAVLLAAALPSLAHAAGAGGECHGVISAGTNTDTANLPPGNFKEAIKFTTGTPATLGTAKKAEAIAGSFLMTIDQACTGFNPITNATATSSQPVCIQGGTFTGTIDVNGNMIFLYSDPPSPAKAGTGLFDGCEETFFDQPVTNKTQAVWVPNAESGVPTGSSTGNALIFQEPTPTGKGAVTPPMCKVAGARLVFTCLATND